MKKSHDDLNQANSADRWASSVWKRIRKSGLLEEEDTAVIYYSTNRLRERLDQLRIIFDDEQAIHTVAIKTHPHPHVLEQIVKAGFGLEAASFEEVQLAVAAGAPFDRITYNSPVKTRREIAYCEEHYPGLRLNANSLEELARMDPDTRMNLGLRINPLIQASSQDLYNVSGAESKFGVPIDQSASIMEQRLRFRVNTLHLHVGSQIGSLGKVVDAIESVVKLADALNSLHEEHGGDGPIKYLNIGGGIPAGADEVESLETMRNYVALIGSRVPALSSGRYRLITEFGQWVHKHNGLVFSEVEYVKRLRDKSIAYVHVGADLFLREAYTELNPLNFVCLKQTGECLEEEVPSSGASDVRAGQGFELYDIAGPLCFNGDYLGKDRFLPVMNAGDIIAIPSTGANSYGLWSRHCSRKIPAIFTDSDKGDGVEKIIGRQAV